MSASPVKTGRGALARLAGALALVAAGPALAAQPIPLPGGTYCGPGDARIVVDVAHDQVEIDKVVCSFPVIAADRMQSDLCSTPQGQSVSKVFDFRVVGRDFVHDGAWYRLCATTPAKPGT